MKHLTYILLCIVGLGASYLIFNNGGEASFLSILLGFWTGYFGYMILNWSDKK